MKNNYFCVSKQLLFRVLGVILVFVFVSLLYPFIAREKIQCGNSISCKKPPQFETETNAIGVYNNKPIHAPNITLSSNENTQPVLGIQTSRGNKHIYVNITTQTLSAYEGDVLFMQTPISSGLWGKTPKGEFTIWSKFRATRMTGGSGDDFYDLPNVPYVMFFSNSDIPGSAGFSIHGTYWHNNFGHAMSHGCVNMKTSDVARLFEWADGPSKEAKQGTLVTIFEDPQV